MSDFDVHGDDMTNAKFSDRDIERLLSGKIPEDDLLESLAPLVADLKAEGEFEPSEELVAMIAAQAAEQARATRPDEKILTAGGSGFHTSRRESPMRWRRKLATTLAAVLALSGLTGVAVASDQAAPGDALYGVDLALEKVGIGVGGEVERFDEAGKLVAEGKTAEALTHAADALANVGNEENGDLSDAAEALRAAADAVTSTDEGDADEVRNRVAAMLRFMADNPDGLTGRDLGQAIAERAGGISTEDDAEDAAEAETDAAEDAEDRARDEAERAAEAEEGEGDGPPEGIPGGPPEGVPPGPPTGVAPGSP